MAKHNLLGQQGEIAARHFLEKNGYQILETNFRVGHLELDIIALKNGLLVIAEVRTRSSPVHVLPEETVTLRKIRRIVSAAQAYIRLHYWEGETRFDIISVYPTDKEMAVEHIKDAFLSPSN